VSRRNRNGAAYLAHALAPTGSPRRPMVIRPFRGGEVRLAEGAESIAVGLFLNADGPLARFRIRRDVAAPLAEALVAAARELRAAAPRKRAPSDDAGVAADEDREMTTPDASTEADGHNETATHANKENPT
jgi:hypothetical protein